jgi:hypothetical protein
MDNDTQTNRKVAPIIKTEIVEKSKYKAEIKFCIGKQLEERISDYAKPLQDRTVMPTFIVSHYQNHKELAGLNLALRFERENEPVDSLARVTFLVVHNSQAQKYTLCFPT